MAREVLVGSDHRASRQSAAETQLEAARSKQPLNCTPRCRQIEGSLPGGRCGDHAVAATLPITSFRPLKSSVPFTVKIEVLMMISPAPAYTVAPDQSGHCRESRRRTHRRRLAPPPTNNVSCETCVQTACVRSPCPAVPAWITERAGAGLRKPPPPVAEISAVRFRSIAAEVHVTPR